MQSLSEHDYKHSLLSDSDTEVGDNDTEHYQPRPRGRQLYWLWMAPILTAIASCLITRAYYTHPSWPERMVAADTYSPLYKGFKPRIEKTVMGGDLWGNKSNIFEQDPSPAVDKAWEAITHAKYTLLPEAELLKMDFSAEAAVEWPDQPGKYLVEFHAYHVMHCLDVVRKNSYHNFPHYYNPETLNAIHWTHWTHCLEILRQELMCMPSMHLGRMVWQQGQSQAFPEFRTNRMCMRWEDFDDMVTSIQLPEEYGIKVVTNAHKPAGASERYTPPEGFETIERNAKWMKKILAQGLSVHKDQ